MSRFSIDFFEKFACAQKVGFPRSGHKYVCRKSNFDCSIRESNASSFIRIFQNAMTFLLGYINLLSLLPLKEAVQLLQFHYNIITLFGCAPFKICRFSAFFVQKLCVLCSQFFAYLLRPKLCYLNRCRPNCNGRMVCCHKVKCAQLETNIKHFIILSFCLLWQFCSSSSFNINFNTSTNIQRIIVTPKERGA